MESVDTTSQLDLDETWLSRLQEEFAAARVTDDCMCETLKCVQQSFGYTVDPHTAVAIAAAESLGYSLSQPQETPVAILSTASPVKFEESVTVALGKDGWTEYFENEFPESAKALFEKPETEPVVYRIGQDWEALTRNIVDELGQIETK